MTTNDPGKGPPHNPTTPLVTHAEADDPGDPQPADMQRIPREPDVASMEIPADAGTYRDALIAILSRIPPHWGRWIDCEAGWFPLIAQVHGELLDLDPNYVVRQVKQKFGALRYYAGSSIDEPLIQERFSALLDMAERFSTTICEVCGEPARLSVSDDPDPLYKTICASCAARVAAAGGRTYHPYVAPPR